MLINVYVFQTDAEVDLKGIRMHTVALRREVMDATGVDLINWAEYYIAPVESYAQVPTANRIKLLLSTNGRTANTNTSISCFNNHKHIQYTRLL